MTVLENLKFAAQLKKIEKSRQKDLIYEAMDMVQITDMKDRLIKNLSKGYKQRVGLAQALLGNPETIILDEPTVGLDPKQIIEIRDLIKSLGERHTVILSSHILSEVSAICDYVMIISHGKLVASDTPENLAKLMEGENSLELTVRGEKSRIQAALKEFSQVEELDFTQSEEKGAEDVRLKTRGNEDVREELFYALANARLPILRMQAVHVSLEDIFLELIDHE